MWLRARFDVFDRRETLAAMAAIGSGAWGRGYLPSFEPSQESSMGPPGVRRDVLNFVSAFRRVVNQAELEPANRCSPQISYVAE